LACRQGVARVCELRLVRLFMGLPPAPLALFAVAGCMLIISIVLIGISSGVANDAALEHEGILIATRSRYVLGQVAGASACDGSNGCDGSCEPIDLASSVPAFAYFHFYNITNPDAVTSGGAPVLAEVGPYTCVTAPPVMTARITRTSTTLSSDSSAVSMTYEQSLECDAVRGGGDDIIYLFDKTLDSVRAQAVNTWVDTLKGTVLSAGDTVGTGGARAFQSYQEHGNSSTPNNYMRREADDAPVLPVFPHGFVRDGGTRLEHYITPETTLQWHLASIGHTVTFTWQYGLYAMDPVFDEYMYARFAGYLPQVDLASRTSALFDTAYSYHTCAPPASSTTVQLDGMTGYPGCASLLDGEALSSDDFFLDISLMLGIPAPMLDDSGGGWQAWEVPAFTDVAETHPNCTGTYKDSNVAGFMWSWGFWGGVMPFVAHTEIGYDPISPGKPSKFLAEFGVSRTGGTLPAFAFSMMPKMLPLMSPSGLGASFPFLVLGKSLDLVRYAYETCGLKPSGFDNVGEYLVGAGALYYFQYFSTAIQTMYLYPGIYTICYTCTIVLPVAMYRLKVDTR